MTCGPCRRGACEDCDTLGLRCSCCSGKGTCTACRGTGITGRADDPQGCGVCEGTGER
ncbi:MAG: hypothetical protein RL134_636 [Actinomycetota bacterium]|jgi:hypothetical protein